MAIFNPDGSEYKVAGSIQQFDPENPEFDLFNSWDQEAIQMGGTPVMYYEVHISQNTINPTYGEDRGKFWDPNYICLYGYYNPIPPQNNLGLFGVDAPDELMIEFNLSDVKRRIGHLPVVGSRLYTPHKRENWVIIQRNIEEYKLWGELRLQLMCQRFRESLSTGEGRVTQKEPDFNIDTIRSVQ